MKVVRRAASWAALALAIASPAAAGAGDGATATGWIEPPRVLSVHLVERVGSGDLIATLATPLDRAAPVRVAARLLRAGAADALAVSIVTWRGGWLTARWPAEVATPGQPYDVRLCPAGGVCAPAVRFVAPTPWARAAAPGRPRPAAPLVAGLSLVCAFLLARRSRHRRAGRYV